MTTTKECPLCGTIFTAHPLRVYCSLKCQRKVNKTRRRDRDIAEHNIPVERPPLTDAQRQKEWDEIQAMEDIDINTLLSSKDVTITIQDKP